MVIHQHHHEQFHNSQVFIFGHGLNSLKVFITMNSLIVPSILMAGHCCPLHLATPANHHISHKYNHNHNSQFILHIHNYTCSFIKQTKSKHYMVWFLFQLQHAFKIHSTTFPYNFINQICRIYIINTSMILLLIQKCS
jgi:hypothetical protein